MSHSPQTTVAWHLSIIATTSFRCALKLADDSHCGSGIIAALSGVQA